MMDDRWQIFFEKFPGTVTSEQLPVKLPRFDLDLCDLAGAAADWCHQYLKDRKCPHDLITFLTQKIINNLRVQWAVDRKLFGYRPEKEDYQALWLMQRVIAELNEVCLNHATVIPYHRPISFPIWWSSFVLKNARRQMEDYISVVPYLHTLFDVKDCGEASFYAVYDGHNGLDAAVYSSMYLHQHLVQSMHYPADPEKALYEAFFNTDDGFTQKTEKYNLVSGTTAVCALHRPKENKLYVGWVGDSIATIWKNGTPLCLVNKHVPERHDETQRIENEGGMISKCQGIWRVDGQLAVSRAIGDVKYKPHITCQPEMRTLVLDGNEEFLVLCSDGLWGSTTPEDVSETIYDELLKTDGDVSEVSNKLVFKSKAQGSKDNISVITVFLQDPKHLVAKRRAIIMETAMEQRNATSTLSSYGQDATDFGPETDVDTPDEPIGLAKPKAEGEVNIVDESGEDSEEDGGGWNYYKKSTEGTEKNSHQEDNAENNSDVEDMDYKLNPDAPEFVPVSSPTSSINNQAQRFLKIDSDDFISSSPQKFKESIDNVTVPDENDFNNEIKVHAGDLSKLNNICEPNDDSSMLNGIKTLNDEAPDHDETVDNFVFQNEHITNGNVDTYQNPFASDDKDDLNKVQDLSEYIKDDAHEDSIDPYVSIVETTKNNEINSISGDDELQNASTIQLNDDFSMGEHIKYELDMNSKNIDDSINTTAATVGSALQFDDESSKNDDDFKNEFMDNIQNEKYGQYEDRKLNDSVSTTDAILGSEPHTPMRMDNQSTFESENDDDQFSESFKQQLLQFDENNDKENHDPFCFEQVEDPAGIIPNVTHEVIETVSESLHNTDSVNPNNSSSDEHQVPELNKHEPVEEPLCIKEKAKPIHSVYEQQYLPESDFSASIHEALLNATESESNHHENYINNENIGHNIVETHVESKPTYAEPQNVEHLDQYLYNTDVKDPTYTEDVKQNDSGADDSHVENLKQDFYHDNMSNIKQENVSFNSEHSKSEKLDSENAEHNEVYDEHKYGGDYKHENDVSDNMQNHINDHEDLETIKQEVKDIKQENNDVADIQDYYAGDLKQEHSDNTDIQNHDVDFVTNNFEHEYLNHVTEDKIKIVKDSKSEDQFDKITNVEDLKSEIQFHKINNVEDLKSQDQFDKIINVEDLKAENQFNVEAVQNHAEKTVETAIQNQVENIEQTYASGVLENISEDFKQEEHFVAEPVNNHVDISRHDITNVQQNQVDDFKYDVAEVQQNQVDDFKYDVAEVQQNHVEDFKQESVDVNEIVQNHNADIQLEHQIVESIQNHTADSDEEMHSSMIIHSDVENNMPQPYCSASDTLLNESDMMCTSMTFEENFQNRNMSDSLYVMETSSDYFGDELQQAPQINKSIDETKVEEQSSNINDVEPVKTENQMITEPQSELVTETKIEDTEAVKTESIQLSSQDPVEKVVKEDETNEVAEIAVAAAVGTAAIAAVAGASLASKKSATKKLESTLSKAKTTTTKTPTTSTKPLVSKTSAPLKKTALSTTTTTSKPLSRPTTAPSTSKPITKVRPTTVPKTTTTSTLKVTSVAKAAPKPAPKTTTAATRPTSAKTTPTTPRTSITKTTPISSPKTPTTPKTPVVTKSASTPKTSTTARTSTLITKQPLTNGSPKPLSRPISAPMKKPLSSVTTNGTTKLTNGVSKTSTTTKPPVSLATRMSLAPPKLPPKAKAVPKTETLPAMPGPIRRPKAEKKTETATS